MTISPNKDKTEGATPWPLRVQPFLDYMPEETQALITLFYKDDLVKEVYTKNKNRVLNNFVSDIYADNTEGVPFEEIIADIYGYMYLEKEANVFKALKLEYKPLENYNRVFTKQQREKTRDEFNSSTTTSEHIDNTNKLNEYAFNSTDYTPSTENKTYADNNTITTTPTGYNDHTFEVENYKEQTSGNIGVTTSQQMLQSEIDLRTANQMKKLIYDDICDFLFAKCI